jgi:phosphopantetheinyl transferase
MPVKWQKKESDYSIIIWQSTESIDELLKSSLLNAEEELIWKGFKSETRRREWLTVRCALRILNPESLNIYYDQNRKPHLQGNLSISISHSHEFIAVMTSQKSNAGVDIEIIHPRIETLSKKFIGVQEAVEKDENYLEKLQVFWGAKEVLYKIHGIGGVDFKKDLYVHSFKYGSSGSLTAEIVKTNFEKKVTVNYEKFGQFMLAWATY